MNPKYRFFLQINEGGEKIAANPVYSDDVTLDYELENKQRFYRAKLSGTFKFVRQDYANIMAAEFDTVYYFYIEKSNDWGQTWTQYYKSMFMRTDCTINDDDQVVTVKPNAIDQYNDVLAGLEKEYNLISLAPEIERITLKKRPLIQIYVRGESILSCFLNGLTWEQDAENTSNQDILYNNYHFGYLQAWTRLEITDVMGNNPNEILGEYVETYRSQDASNAYVLRRNKHGYIIRENASYDMTLSNPQGNVIYRLYGEVGITDFEDVNNPNNKVRYTNLSPINVYGRLLLDVDTWNGKATFDLPGSDITANNRNYRKVYPMEYATWKEIIYTSFEFSNVPNEYGKRSDNKYYMPPNSGFAEKYYPIGRSQWTDTFSFWFAFHSLDKQLEEMGRKTYILRDNYPLYSVISVLLKQFAPEIKHEATPEYSHFLYDDTNPITGDSFRLFITPKSNILLGEYQTPTQKSPATLQQILTMLCNTFQLYWHIENNKLCIEHISYYRNGGTYKGNSVVGYDLTQLENIRNGKKWAFGASEYSFDKENMPERYQFSWGDDVTDVFEGQPIQIVSKYIQPGKIEEINIGGFNPDIDLMLLNPEAISQEGFALFAAVYNNDTRQYELPFVQYDIDNLTYYLQNGFLAMVNLQPQYWLYDMPARNLIVNNVQVWAYGIQRRKSQTITFPVGDNEPDVMELIKTNIGNGEIQKISINLSSRTAKATVKYDTE